MSTEDVALGAYVQGMMEAHDIPPKELALQSGVHESTLSRFFNGIKPINDRQKIQIGIGIGKSVAKKYEVVR